MLAEQKGPFVGVDGGYSRMLIDRRGSNESIVQNQASAGENAGWRIALPAGLYATPWIGVSYAFGAKDVTLGGSRFTNEVGDSALTQIRTSGDR